MNKEINLFDFSRTDQRRQEKEQRNLAKRIVEALLFASHEPVSFQRLREVLETKLTFKPKFLHDILEDLQEEYIEQNRAFRLEEVSQGYVLKTCAEYSSFIDELYRNKRTEKLSQAASEVLAIIAYKQPITRPQIELIRGVDSSGTLQNLLERELIQEAGKLDAPGRPTLYQVTERFLFHFGLKDLKELPPIDKIS